MEYEKREKEDGISFWNTRKLILRTEEEEENAINRVTEGKGVLLMKEQKQKIIRCQEKNQENGTVTGI